MAERRAASPAPGAVGPVSCVSQVRGAHVPPSTDICKTTGAAHG